MGRVKVEDVLEAVEHTVNITLLHVEVTECLEFVEHVGVIEHVDAATLYVEAGMVVARQHANEAGATSPLNSS